MTTQEHGWMVCAPGDPNDIQVRLIHSMTSDQPFCITHYNADTDAVRFTTTDPAGEEHSFEVEADGNWQPLHL